MPNSRNASANARWAYCARDLPRSSKSASGTTRTEHRHEPRNGGNESLRARAGFCAVQSVLREVGFQYPLVLGRPGVRPLRQHQLPVAGVLCPRTRRQFHDAPVGRERGRLARARARIRCRRGIRRARRRTARSAMAHPRFPAVRSHRRVVAHRNKHRRTGMMATRFESLSPILAVDDLHQALAFYRDLLGFSLAWCWGEPPELAGICRDAVEMTLMARTDKPEGRARVYLRITGIDALYAGLERAGADVTVPIGDRPYGLRDFRIVDPGGNELDIGEVIATPEAAV